MTCLGVFAPVAASIMPVLDNPADSFKGQLIGGNKVCRGL